MLVVETIAKIRRLSLAQGKSIKEICRELRVSRKVVRKVRFDNNKYSVLSTAVGRPVEVQAYANRIVIRQDGIVVAEHARSFGRGETVYDPWHYVPVLSRKPGALRNGAPFQGWVLPSATERARRRLKSPDDGGRDSGT